MVGVWVGDMEGMDDDGIGVGDSPKTILSQHIIKMIQRTALCEDECLLARTSFIASERMANSYWLLGVS
jgi:hypothetical protein